MIFDLTEEDKRKITCFKKNHNCKIPTDNLGQRVMGTIGGKLTYCFTPTSLGTICIVKCACGAELDLTSYEGW